MNIMRRRVLQLVGIGAVTIASPMLASAVDAETGGCVQDGDGTGQRPAQARRAAFQRRDDGDAVRESPHEAAPWS